jgi:hypothetical protein
MNPGIIPDITIHSRKLYVVIRQRGETGLVIVKAPDFMPLLDEDIDDLLSETAGASGNEGGFHGAPADVIKYTITPITYAKYISRATHIQKEKTIHAWNMPRRIFAFIPSTSGTARPALSW